VQQSRRGDERDDERDRGQDNSTTPRWIWFFRHQHCPYGQNREANHHHGQQDGFAQADRRKFGCAKRANNREIGQPDKDLSQIEGSDQKGGPDE